MAFTLRNRSKFGDQVYVNDIKLKGKGKTRAGKQRAGYDLQIEADIPGVGGNLSSNRIGGIWVSELIDSIRTTWSQGKSLDGTRPTLSPNTKRGRYYRKWAVTESGTTTKKNQRKLNKVKKHYTKSWTETKTIDGIKTKTRKKSLYIPDPDGGAVTDSGYMSASLRGSYRRGRSFTNKAGVHTEITSHMRIAVAENRARSARYVGGLNNDAGILKGNINGGNFKSKFPNTAYLVNNALYWRDRKTMIARIQKVIRALQIMRTVIRIVT